MVCMFAWRPFEQFYFATAVVVEFLILPVWILWLAAQLRRLSQQGAYTASVEMAQPNAGTKKGPEADANVV